jgi:hypothetical protein
LAPLWFPAVFVFTLIWSVFVIALVTNTIRKNRGR